MTQGLVRPTDPRPDYLDHRRLRRWKVDVVGNQPRRPIARRQLMHLIGALALCLAAWSFSHVSKAESTSRAAPPSQPPRPYDWGPLPVIDQQTRTSRIDPRLSRVASRLAGHALEVRCWSESDWKRLLTEYHRWPNLKKLGDWSAVTSWDLKRINLSPRICAPLAHVAYGDFKLRDEHWPDAIAYSVSLLGHESSHAVGIRNEATAECRGMQLIPRTSRELGLSVADGRLLAELYWRSSYPTLDPMYRSPECRDGGDFDVRPNSDVWP
jgi:hypothetical protein